MRQHQRYGSNVERFAVKLEHLLRRKRGKNLLLVLLAASETRNRSQWHHIQDTDTWDEDMTYGCVCDSSWPVGLGSGETQEPEWFGADCSLSKMSRCVYVYIIL